MFQPDVVVSLERQEKQRKTYDYKFVNKLRIKSNTILFSLVLWKYADFFLLLL